MAKKKKEPEVKAINKPLLRNINDHSGGGFILFNFNAEGLPEVHSNFEGHLSAMALQHYIQNWAKAIEAVTVETMSQNILEEPESDEPDDEEDPSEI